MNAEQARRKFESDFGHDVMRLLDIIIDDRIARAAKDTDVEQRPADQSMSDTPLKGR